MEFLRLFLEYLNKAENLELNINTNMNVITSFYKFLEHCKQFYNGEVEVLHTDYWNKKQCKTLTLNFAKKICEDFGSLIEHPKIYSENETIDKILQEILTENDFENLLKSEKVFANGNHLIFNIVENGEIKLKKVDVNNFYPLEIINNKILKFIIYSQNYIEDKIFTEYYVYDKNFTYKYTFQNNNNFGNFNNLGNLISKEVLENPILDYNFSFFVNYTPNTINNKVELPLGIPIYGNSLDTLKLIDTVFNGMEIEFRTGKRKIFLDETLLKRSIIKDVNGRPIAKQTFSEDEIYQVVNNDNSSGTNDISQFNNGKTGMTSKIQATDFNLRTKEFIDTLQYNIGLLAEAVGLGSKFYEFASGIPTRTATEVISEKTNTFRSIQKHEELFKSNITKQIQNIFILYNFLNNTNFDLQNLELRIEYNDSTIIDDETKAKNDLILVGAGVISKKYYLMTHLDLKEEEAEKMLIQIKQEEAQEFVDFAPLEENE